MKFYACNCFPEYPYILGYYMHLAVIAHMMAESAEDGGSGSPLDLLKRFYALQEERVEAYRFLER